jgi:hypothetical protein
MKFLARVYVIFRIYLPKSFVRSVLLDALVKDGVRQFALFGATVQPNKGFGIYEHLFAMVTAWVIFSFLN